MISDDKTIWIAKLSETPLGDIWTARGIRGLVAIDLWGDQLRFVDMVRKLTGVSTEYNPEKLAAVNRQLSEYFSGQRQRFEEPIDWSVMIPFQRDVLEVVNDIEFGQTRTYGDIAKQLNKPKAVRAVGRANATNPIPLIIPCHRVLGSDGRLRGYGAPGGVETKAWLLRLEGGRLI